MYRELTAVALAQAANLNDGEALAALVGVQAPDGTDLRAEAISRNVSAVSRHPQVRARMRARQRELAVDAVLEGRDTGSVVCPDADLKVYLVASNRVRAERRAADLGLPVDEVEQSLTDRDDMDADQLAPAPDARLLDTSALSVDEVVDRIVALAGGVDAEPAQTGAGGVPGDRFWKTVRPWAEPMFKGLLRARVSGRELVPRTGAVVFVANHQSLWDIPALGVAQPRAIRFMARATCSVPGPSAPSCAWAALSACGGESPIASALRTVHETLEAGGVVGVFIQGHRQEGLDEAKAGAGRIAVVEDAAVVPVAIRSRGWRPGRSIRIAFGAPRHYERGQRRAAQAYRETADELMAEIRRLYEQTA